MKVTIDTNVLVRLAVQDDETQTQAAQALFAEGHELILTLPMLCEFVWVLRRGYGIPYARIAEVMRELLTSETIGVDRRSALAGVAMLEAGGDFADAVIAHEGRWLGAETFVSFDRRAVKLLAEAGEKARLLEA